LWQTFDYDWLGNSSKTDDDARGFYDRSLGTVTNDTANDKPYQLQSASNESLGGTRTGATGARYDAAGNLTRLDVERNGTCLGGQCSQRFDYRWDEVGRLTRARRWDVAGSSLTTPDAALPNDSDVDADLEYVYDENDDRVLKTARAGSAAAHTAYIFDSLELRRTAFQGDEYTQSVGSGAELTETEVPYLFGHGVRLARVVYEQTNDGEPRLASSGRQHVFFELGDHLGSTSVVLDKATSELVERGAFQAYGAKESDYRPDRWKGFREDYGFTGKEEDVEVGLAYFGKRFLSPYLGRWVSADPLAIHSPGAADLNLYAYVRGAALKAIDPLGLQEAPSPQDIPDGGYPAPTDMATPGGKGVVNVTEIVISAKPRPKQAAPAAAPTNGSEAGEAVLGLLGTQALAAAKSAASTGAEGALTLACPMCSAYLAYERAGEPSELATNPGKLLEDPYVLADVTGQIVPGAVVGGLASSASRLPKLSLERPSPPIHSRYPDGKPVLEGRQPGKIKGPDTNAEGRAHTRVQWDESNSRVYKARQYDPGGVPVRDIDFTHPTFPDGRLRPNHTVPEQHRWKPNDPKNPRAGYERQPGEPLENQ
jgi:RHS repeat-associated protein